MFFERVFFFQLLSIFQTGTNPGFSVRRLHLFAATNDITIINTATYLVYRDGQTTRIAFVAASRFELFLFFGGRFLFCS